MPYVVVGIPENIAIFAGGKILTDMKEVCCIYFSATSTTARCVEAIVKGLGLKVRKRINLADDPVAELPGFSSDDVVVVGMPVYGGRLPGLAAEALGRLRGGGAPAIAVVVYGNRDYDDALLELTDILTDTGFNILGAGAFIGEHSIFPKVAAGRPDDDDMEQLEQFGRRCMERLRSNSVYRKLSVKGTRPYKKYSGVPVHPECDANLCGRCGECARKCPSGAISPDNPVLTDAERCISCGRCIKVCTRGARSYSGIKYGMIARIFKAGFSRRRNPEWSVAD